MRLERVDEKTIKCFLSNEELANYDITYKDFIVRSDKARDLMDKILGQARQELGYRLEGISVDLQIMMMPEQGLLLTFSEAEPPEIWRELLENMSQMEMDQELVAKRGAGLLAALALALEDAKKRAGADEAAEGGPSEKKKGKEKSADKKKSAEEKPQQAVFFFEELRPIMDMAQALPKGLRIGSRLYRMPEGLYLHIYKGRAAYDKFSRVCIRAMEYGRLCPKDRMTVAFLEEHGSPVGGDGILKTLGSI